MSTLVRWVIALGGLWCPPVEAQSYHLRDGTRLEASAVERRGHGLVERLTEPGDEGLAERWHDVTEIIRLEWPEPAGLSLAREQLARGSPDEALAHVEPVVAEFAAFARVEGSWWDEAALLQAEALLAAGRSADASPVVQALVGVGSAVGAPATRLLFVEIDLQQGRVELAAAMLNRILAEGPLPADLAARAAWLRGEVRLRQGEHEAALEAFLEIPAFHSRERILRPAVLWGSAQAYQRYGDIGRAVRALEQLLLEYPQHPLAAAAQGALSAMSSSTP